MSTYIPIEEFKKKVEILNRNIERKIFKNSGCVKKIVFVDVNTVKDGDCVPWGDPRVKGVVLSNKPPEVYHETISRETYNRLNVRVVLHVEDIVYENNPLGLPWASYTFDRYEDYLKLLSDTILENQPVGINTAIVCTTIKETNTPLAGILSVHEFGELPADLSLIANDFTILERYRKLPEQVKKEVDSIVCPITFYPKDIFLDVEGTLDFIRIALVRVSKKEILQHQNQTHLYQEDLDEFLK